MDITTTRVATRALKWTTTRWLIAAHLSWQHDSASQRLRSQTPTGLRPWPFSSTVHEQGKSPRFTLTREQINSKNIRNIQTAASNRCVYPCVRPWNFQPTSHGNSCAPTPQRRLYWPYHPNLPTKCFRFQGNWPTPQVLTMQKGPDPWPA